MANPLPNEAEIFQKITNERITIPAFLWDAIYNFLGDYVSVINLLTTYRIEQNRPIEVLEAKLILEQTRKIMEVIRKVIYPHQITDEKGRFVKIKEESIQLPGFIRECFTHYVGNDTHIINMCICAHIDSVSEEPVPVEEARKILEASLSISHFLERLRRVTSPVGI